MSLQEKYKKEVVPVLKERFGYKNVMQVPKVTSVTVNVGVGQALQDSSFRDMVVMTLEKITGQKPVTTRAKKSISAFKIREGQSIGMKVTMRGSRMYDFIEKLVRVALPRVRDFRGLDPKSFDVQGNITIGLKEHLVFPEIDTETVDRIHGLEITITTSARNKTEGLELLKALGFPFRQ